MDSLHLLSKKMRDSVEKSEGSMQYLNKIPFYYRQRTLLERYTLIKIGGKGENRD